jgi:hypothetical protein
VPHSPRIKIPDAHHNTTAPCMVLQEMSGSLHMALVKNVFKVNCDSEEGYSNVKCNKEVFTVQ